MENDAANALETVLSCISKSDEFPALAETIGVINRLTSKDETTVTELANIILNDLSLTTKILKIVNSALYRQFGEITTISRAVMILGHRNIRNIAMSLVLFKQLSAGRASRDLSDLLIKALFSGLLAKEIARPMDSVDTEEAFICALISSLGEIMVAFYMPDKYAEVKRLIQEQALKDNESAAAVLGSSFDSIGKGIAQAWHFPEKIVMSMTKVRSSEVKGRLTELDILRTVSTVSNEIANVLSSNLDNDEKKREIDRLVASYKDSVGPLSQKIEALFASALSEMQGQSAFFDLNLRGSPLMRELSEWSSVQTPVAAKSVQLKARDTSLDSLTMFSEPGMEDHPETFFTRGIQEVSNALLSDYSLDDVLRIVLEATHRGLRFSGGTRTLLFVRDRERPVMNLRFGLGDALQDVKKWFTIPLGNTQDIFNIALSQGRDLIINDIDEPEVKPLFPEWYLTNISSGFYVILLPLVINNKPIGMLYADGPKGDFGRISKQSWNHLKILRDQSILAIRQKT